VARCGYHGWHDWCLPLEDFVPEGLAEQVYEFSARDPASLEALFARHPDRIAAVIVAPEMVTPYDPRVFHELCRITRSQGALFVMDEVKTGLRIAPNSVAERAGIVPDLLTVSKALGNGWPVAALLGRSAFMASGAGMHYSATFHGDTAGMAAALASLAWIKDHGVQLHVETLGQALIDGLNERARRHDLPAVAYGEPLPAMPFLRFSHPDPTTNGELSRAFYRSVLSRGILLHPRHMWFISHAHTPADIAETLEAADLAFADARHVLEMREPLGASTPVATGSPTAPREESGREHPSRPAPPRPSPAGLVAAEPSQQGR
jgi:glutamate-1-semialdehyde aminotransferase